MANAVKLTRYEGNPVQVVLHDTLFVYYGGADKYACVATCKLDELLDHLEGCPA